MCDMSGESTKMRRSMVSKLAGGEVKTCAHAVGDDPQHQGRVQLAVLHHLLDSCGSLLLELCVCVYVGSIYVL